MSVKLRPSAKLAVLGLVLQRPSYGYELVARFERVFSEQPWEWRVTAPAIYGALRDLEAERLIEPIGSEDATSPQRQSRQNYRVTGEGARSMREWLATPMSGDPSREEFLIRLHFGDASDDALRDLLRRHTEACMAELERIARAPASTRMQRLVKEDRWLAVQARLSWIDAARAPVESSSPASAPLRVACEGRDRRTAPKTGVTSMRSSIDAAVLSLVIEKPSYGGEIGRRFERRYEGLLVSDAQQVCKALDDLEHEGLIELTDLDGASMSGYRATDEGARRYHGWLRAPIPLDARTRREVVIRLASTRPEDLATAERLLDIYEHAVLEDLRKGAPDPGASTIEQLIDEERRTVGDARVRWVARARDMVRERAARREP